MKKAFFFTLLLFLFTNCQYKNKEIKSSTQKTPMIHQVAVYDTYGEVESLFQHKNDTTYIINFWATTCPPCLKEMPHFEELEKVYPNKKIRIILVSLDLKRHLESRVLPFIEKHKINSEVVLLADQNYSSWTGKVDPSWYGALPATLILKKEDKRFSFGAYETFADLERDLKSFVIEN